jgi:membrane-bound serine protease (ClpP class)
MTLLSARTSYSNNQNKVLLVQLNDDTINPVTADYIIKSVDRAFREKAQCLIIKMDTPGGLLTSTRMIVKKMLTSPVPVVVYVAPSGSRAGSAGVFITYASHVAAMAPSTNIGAAHPVQMGEEALPKSGEWQELRKLIGELREMKKAGKKTETSSREEDQPSLDNSAEETEAFEADDNPMESKLLHDTVAFIKAIALARGRNVEWAVESVVKSDSVTSEEAMKKGVIEIIADSDEHLLAQLDGRVVQLEGKRVTLQTKGARIEQVDMDARQKFFNVLANPNIAYILMILGFYGLLFEVTHPGFGLPGILGAIFLILAFYSMQTLPTNYAGLALLILGVVLLIAEAFTPAFGALTLSGAACMILGSMLLFDSADPIMDVSGALVIGVPLTAAAITLFLTRSVLRARRAKVHGGTEGLVGETGEAYSTFEAGGKGKVFIHGELWNAVSRDALRKGEDAVIVSVEGLTLNVQKK